MSRAASVERAVADAHRREGAFVLAATVRVARDLDLAEECVQEAYVTALDVWKRDGVPERPGAWLTTTAKRKALDALRRGQTLRSKLPLLVEPYEPDEVDMNDPTVIDTIEGGAVPDDRLRLIFTCCHPALLREAQVALNRAVAVAEVRGPEVALREVETLERDGRLSGYRYLQSTKADLLRRLGRHHEAAHSYRAALDLADNEAERRFLASRLAESSGRRGSASLRREFVTRGVASNPWERVGKPVDYLCTGRVGIAETNRQRVRILAVGARDGRLGVTETDLELGDGRTLHAYDTGADDEDGRLAVFWHHGSPNIGAPPEPLFPAAEELGVRWVSYDRPGYGGSTPLPDRDVASAAADVSSVADALGIDRFAVMGHSGGGSHALACAALLPERVLGAVVVAGMAPYHAEGLDWFEGFGPGGEAQLRAAAAGRAALEKHLAESDDEPGFTPEDEAALAGEWSWFIDIVRPALAGGMGGFIDDDLAGVGAWGFEPADIVAPVLLLHGGRDRVVPSSHGEWLARRCPSSELWLRPDDGHISVLNYGAAALGWLREHAHRG